jgi:hypothetical protein
VSADVAIEPTPAWEAYGLFDGSKMAWLVAHEPFAGAGRAWLCTAELLVATPTTRPKEARRLLLDLSMFVAGFCKGPKPTPTAAMSPGDEPSEFAFVDAPYLLAILGLPGTADLIQAAQFTNRRLGIVPDMATLERLLAQADVQAELRQPIGKRQRLAKVVDDFGMRSYRLDIEETTS